MRSMLNLPSRTHALMLDPLMHKYHLLCTKLDHMLINHCFLVVVTVSFVYCHYVSFTSSSSFYILYINFYI